MKQIFFFLFFHLIALAQTGNSISVISVEKANTVYRGITNLIKVGVPGAKSYIVTAPGKLEKLDGIGNYHWNVTGVSGLKAVMKIDITMPDGLIVTEEKEFAIKSINRPKAYISSDFQEHIYEMTHEQLRTLKVKTIIDNFFHQIDTTYYRVESFMIQVEGKEHIYVIGDKMNIDAYEQIKNLAVGSDLVIQYVEQYNPEGYHHWRLNSIHISLVAKEDIRMPKPLVITNYRNNIIYRGIDNPLNISVPGAKGFKVRAEGLSEMVEDSTYVINVSKIRSDTLSLNFEIAMQNDSIIYAKELLYIKDITPKKITINGKGCSDCIQKMTLSELQNATIDIRIDSPEETWANIRIFYFEIKMPDGKVLEIRGNKVDDEAIEKLSQFKNDSLIEIRVPYYEAQGFTYDPSPLKIKVVKNL